MRVLLNGLNAGNRSGTGRYIVELSRELLRSHHAEAVRVLWPQEMSAPAPDYDSSLLRKPASPLRRVLFEHLRMDSTARAIGADILHCPTGIGPLRTRLPVALTVHDLCFLHHPEWFPRSRAWYYRAVLTAGIQRADCLIADSHATADDLQRLLHIPESRIHVVPLGVDASFAPASPSEQKKVRQKYKVPEKYFLFVGTIEPRKNLERLCQAWATIREDAPPLVIAGRHGWGGVTIPRDPHILLPGHIDQNDLPALYSAATAVVWPSLMEGFGLPPLEAMACGAPVLTSNTSSLPEVVGDAGLLVDPLQTDALADAMLRLAQDSDLRQQLREKGMRRAAMFTWEATANKTISAYETLL